MRNAYKLISRGFLLLISILGFASCGGGRIAPEYGPVETKYGIPPQGYFIMRGTVSSEETGKPVPGIKVETAGIFSISDSAGNFFLEIETDAYNENFQMKFTDNEPLQNGNYEDKDTLISFESIDFKGPSDEYHKGEKEINLRIPLNPKK